MKAFSFLLDEFNILMMKYRQLDGLKAVDTPSQT
jgi:hypothetical protein